ncbi:hypothetical protein PV08_01692 [Exophiala spinifera]|uniref:Uncharacterized protein n=1 Tax=Exophiala spinifera TaxID=91928 RepID=A0A0D2A8L6_9EURO|nr:uncharacterized protein PV08_01692 [Exophiala spinifera]KIW21112.1 hypothetical protein PV08_01692 [Exophiala spinifera]
MWRRTLAIRPFASRTLTNHGLTKPPFKALLKAEYSSEPESDSTKIDSAKTVDPEPDFPKINSHPIHLPVTLETLYNKVTTLDKNVDTLIGEIKGTKGEVRGMTHHVKAAIATMETQKRDIEIRLLWKGFAILATLLLLADKSKQWGEFFEELYTDLKGEGIVVALPKHKTVEADGLKTRKT